MQLGHFLGLRPLDRVQINNRRENEEMRSWSRTHNTPSPLPFFYFQRVLQDGKLDVRAPSGYALTLDPGDICDVVRGEPLVLRVMPEKIFLERSRLPLAERQSRPGDECYADAHILYAQKDRWGNVDAFVWFIDPHLNGERPWRGPIHDADQTVLKQKATRKRMPVLSRTPADYSADHNLKNQADFARNVVTAFIRQAIHGNKMAVESLALASIQKPDRRLLHLY